jgi:general secretion pathway protein G
MHIVMNTHLLRAPVRTTQAGFTLVEIMVVVVILGLLATLVVPAVMSAGDEARETKARTDVRAIADAVKMYRTKKGKMPESLDVLVEKDDKGRNFLDELPKDPWDNDYRILAGDRANEFEIVSIGPDGTENTEDDISSKAKKES